MAVGLFMFYCTISILADSFLGLDIGLGIAHTASPGAHTLAGVARLIGHTLLASSITALIGAAWMIIWFAQGPEWNRLPGRHKQSYRLARIFHPILDFQ